MPKIIGFHRIERERFEDLADQIHKIFPDWPIRNIFYRSKRNSDTEVTSNGGLLYNHYKTFRERLREAGMLIDVSHESEVTANLGGDNDTEFEGIKIEFLHNFKSLRITVDSHFFSKSFLQRTY